MVCRLNSSFEMNARDLVDHIAQQVADLHPVVHDLEDGGNHVAAVVAARVRQRAQVAEQPRPALPVRPRGFLGVDEGKQLVARDPVRLRRPIAPAIRLLHRRLELLPGQLRLLLALDFEVVEELEKHDPRQQRQTAEIAVQALVLAHDVTRGFEEAAEGLGGGGLLVGGFGHDGRSGVYRGGWATWIAPLQGAELWVALVSGAMPRLSHDRPSALRVLRADGP